MIEDWHYPKEEAVEMAALMAANLRVTALTATTNTSGSLTLRAANGSSATASAPGQRLFGWQLRGFLAVPGEAPLAILRYDAQRWGFVVFLGSDGRLGPSGVGDGVGLRKGVGAKTAHGQQFLSLCIPVSGRI